MYDDFSACAAACLSMTGEEWLAAQTIPFTPEELKEMWYSVRLDSDGACWSPESKLTPEKK
jgi:hypothetical protein